MHTLAQNAVSSVGVTRGPEFMTSLTTRILAIICALLTLASVGVWVLSGAPIAPVVGFARYAALGASDPGITIWGFIVYLFLSVSMWLAAGVLWNVVAPITAAALLSLFVLLRGTQSTAIRYLGVGLGFWSLSFCYLYFLSVAPTFEVFLKVPILLRVACDALAFQMLLASTFAFVKFWHEFPRPVTVDELESFMAAQARDELTFLRRMIPKLWNSKSHGHDRGAVEPARSPVLDGRITSRLTAIPAPVRTTGVVLLVLAASLGWRMGIMDGNPLLLPSILCVAVVEYWPTFRCLRLFKYHRAVGSIDDRRKIEWIWTAIWTSLVLVLLCVPLFLLTFFYLSLFPDLPAIRHAAANYMIFAIMSGPLIFIAALAMSILYRGSVDPRLALRGFTVWTLLSVVLTLVFVFVERSVALRLVKWWGLPSQTSFVTAGAIVAATFQPLRKLVEKYVNRFVERVMPTSLLASGARYIRAVAVVDITAYSALSAHDEQGALLATTFVQKEARRLADKHGGRLVKSTGDGAILCFEVPQQALEAVRELHQTVAAGRAILNLSNLELHSGLHWGELVQMHDGDLYGQTVNITARIADWAKAGEIGISQAFSEQLGSIPQGIEPMGLQSFKNIPQPISCLKLAAY